MPLISLTAAQRSTFLTHVSYSDPSSRARHIPYLRLKGNAGMLGSGMRGKAAGQMAIYIELIFCFMCRFFFFFWSPGRSGLKGEGNVRMSECEVSCRVFHQAAACTHDLRHTHIRARAGPRSHTLHTKKKPQQKVRRKFSEPRLGGRWARCCPLMQRGEVGHSTKWTSGTRPEGMSEL